MYLPNRAGDPNERGDFKFAVPERGRRFDRCDADVHDGWHLSSATVEEVVDAHVPPFMEKVIQFAGLRWWARVWSVIRSA